MTNEAKRNSILVSAMIAGLAIVSLICWVHSASITRSSIGKLTADELVHGDFDLSFDYNLGLPSPYTRLVGAEHFDPFIRIPDNAPAHVRLFTHRGELCGSISLPDARELPEGINAVGKVSQDSLIYRRHPDGLRHPLRRVLLTFELRREKESEPLAVLLQLIELDIMAHTADFVPCLTMPDAYAARPYKDISIPYRGELPSKIDAPPVPAAILRLVYALAAVENQTQADTVAQALREYADRIIRYEPLPYLPWPDNWGEFKPDVCAAARLMAPTLTYLQEHECFHSAQLASFINGQTFETIFGVRFDGDPSDHVQQQSFPVYRKPDLPCDTCEPQN